MRSWKISKRQYALDMQGIGASLNGGRWNNPGVAIIYTGLTIEICALELLVNSSGIDVPDLVIVEYELPDDSSLYLTPAISDLPANWNEVPSAPQSAIYGDDFVSRNTHLGLIVPSAVIPESRNLLLNPKHPAIGAVKPYIRREFTFDHRLAGK